MYNSGVLIDVEFVVFNGCYEVFSIDFVADAAWIAAHESRDQAAVHQPFTAGQQGEVQSLCSAQLGHARTPLATIHENSAAHAGDLSALSTLPDQDVR